MKLSVAFSFLLWVELAGNTELDRLTNKVVTHIYLKQNLLSVGS